MVGLVLILVILAGVVLSLFFDITPTNKESDSLTLFNFAFGVWVIKSIPIIVISVVLFIIGEFFEYKYKQIKKVALYE